MGEERDSCFYHLVSRKPEGQGHKNELNTPKMEEVVNPVMILTDQSRDAVQFWVIWALSFPRILIAWLQAEDVLLPQNQTLRMSTVLNPVVVAR